MSRNTDSSIVYYGTSLIIEYAVRGNGSMPASDFLNSLDVRDQYKMLALFTTMANQGKVPNQQQFKKVREKIFEFKKNQIRVFCFRKDDRWLLTNGYYKKKGKLNPSEIERAERIMYEHLNLETRQNRGRRK